MREGESAVGMGASARVQAVDAASAYGEGRTSLSPCG